MKALEYVSDNEKETLAFLKSRYPLYHLSNVFFRDIQYGIQQMMKDKGMTLSYGTAEKVARAFIQKLERAGVLLPIDAQSWVLQYPEFRKPPTKPAAVPPRPAVPGSAAASPAPAAAQKEPAGS